MSEAELLSEADVRTTTVKHPIAKRKGDPCTMVIFGGAGDLTKRKLIPALCNLAEQGFLPQQFAIIAVTYTDLTTDTFRQQVSDDIKTFALRPVDPAICKRLVEHTYYVRGDFADPGTYERLKATLGEVASKENLPANYFFYLAVAPRFFGEIVRRLGASGLAQEENGCWRRVVIEKPFGRDLQSARALNAEIKQVLDFRNIGFPINGCIRRHLEPQNFGHPHRQNALSKDPFALDDDVVGFLQAIQMNVPIHPGVWADHRFRRILRTLFNLFHFRRGQ